MITLIKKYVLIFCSWLNRRTAKQQRRGDGSFTCCRPEAHPSEWCGGPHPGHAGAEGSCPLHGGTQVNKQLIEQTKNMHCLIYVTSKPQSNYSDAHYKYMSCVISLKYFVVVTIYVLILVVVLFLI